MRVQHLPPLPLYERGPCRIAHQKAVLLFYSQGQLARFRAQQYCSFKSEEIACVCEPVTIQTVPSGKTMLLTTLLL